MDKTIDDAVAFLEETSTALLTTFIGENRLDSRLVGPFVHDGPTVYIFTLNSSNKINQIHKNPCVSLYLQNKFENTKDYKSLSINGKAVKVTNDNEFNTAKEKLERKSHGYKKWIDKDGWEKWAIIKVRPELIKYIDNGKSPAPHYMEIPDNKNC
jgi:general stress protein 26